MPILPDAQTNTGGTEPTTHAAAEPDALDLTIAATHHHIDGPAQQAAEPDALDLSIAGTHQHIDGRAHPTAAYTAADLRFKYGAIQASNLRARLVTGGAHGSAHAPPHGAAHLRANAGSCRDPDPCGRKCQRGLQRGRRWRCCRIHRL